LRIQVESERVLWTVPAAPKRMEASHGWSQWDGCHIYDRQDLKVGATCCPAGGAVLECYQSLSAAHFFLHSYKRERADSLATPHFSYKIGATEVPPIGTDMHLHS
jgi:hypothetical protein